MKESHTKSLLCCAVAILALLCAVYLLMPKQPPDIQSRAIEVHLLEWVRKRLHDNWINGIAFLPDGTYHWGTTYAFRIIVADQFTELEQTPALTATAQYQELSEGQVILNLDSGRTYQFSKKTNQFENSALHANVDRSTWKTAYLYVYGPNN